MKKILVIAALALVSLANAQKGSILVAGNVDFTSQKQGDWKSNSFEFAPKVGYQFNDHMTVGVQTTIGNSKETTSTTILGVTTTTEVKKDNLKLGAFLRYAQPLAGVFSAYADLGVGMQSEKVGSAKSNGFYIGLTPAIGVDMKKGFCLNFSIGGLGYDSMKADATGAEALNTFGLTFGKQASVGISKNF